MTVLYSTLLLLLLWSFSWFVRVHIYVNHQSCCVARMACDDVNLLSHLKIVNVDYIMYQTTNADRYFETYFLQRPKIEVP